MTARAGYQEATMGSETKVGTVPAVGSVGKRARSDGWRFDWAKPSILAGHPQRGGFIVATLHSGRGIYDLDALGVEITRALNASGPGGPA